MTVKPLSLLDLSLHCTETELPPANEAVAFDGAVGRVAVGGGGGVELPFG